MNTGNGISTPSCSSSQSQPRQSPKTRKTLVTLRDTFRARSTVLKQLKTEREKSHWKKFYREFDLKECRAGVEEFRGRVGTVLDQVGGTTDMEIWRKLKKLKTLKTSPRYGSLEKLKQLQGRLDRRREKNKMIYQRQRDSRKELRKELKSVGEKLGKLKEILQKRKSAMEEKSKSASSRSRSGSRKLTASSKPAPATKAPKKLPQKETGKPQRSTRRQSITQPTSPIPSTSGTQRPTTRSGRPRATPDVRFLKEKKPKPKTRSVFSEYRPALDVGHVKMEVPEEGAVQTGGNEEPPDYFALQEGPAYPTIIIPLKTPRPQVTTSTAGTSTTVEEVDRNPGPSTSGASINTPIQAQSDLQAALSSAVETPKKEEKVRKFNIKLKPKSGIGEQSMMNSSLSGNSPGSSSRVSPLQAMGSQSSQNSSSSSQGASGSQRRRQSSSFLTDDFLADLLD